MKLLTSIKGFIATSLLVDSVLSDLNVSNNDTEISDDTPFCKLEKESAVSTSCDVTFKEINQINSNIREDLQTLVNTDFFKYFKLDLYKECPFWDDSNRLCTDGSCSIDIVEDWSQLPEYWQPKALGGLHDPETDILEGTDDECSFLDQLCQGRDQTHPAQPPKFDFDYCDVNEFESKESVLVDLTKNPERFTGYGGQEARNIWQYIYGENCFSTTTEGKCLAKDAFYRLVSGLHASIGVHISNEMLDTKTGKWGPNLDFFMARVGNFPDRITNIYFNYAVVAKALWKIRPYLTHLDFCNEYDNNVKSKIVSITSQLDRNIFHEDLLFKDDLTYKLKDEFRTRFKNVTRIMDCVDCDTCRLWGKVQTTGYATSLKILFELEDADEETQQYIVDKLTKYELIALLNTFDRLSQAIEAINNFEKMYNDKLNIEDNKATNKTSIFSSNNFFKLLEMAKNTINNNLTKRNHEVKEEQVSHKFSDLKMPKKKIVKKAVNDENKWTKAWHTEIGNVMEALRFIYRSYLDLPKNIWTIALSNMNKFWNKFIGVANYLREEEENPTVYKLNIQ
ncbi:hypothetical protein NCAS_0B00130 [Naumovozyma castellii]|uniref:Endoplasmic oxidoreductin n=1 Tax=Naumovozyma castellii TaxID=27288 RepID=G0VAX5_NAUCA|nr:hypothetical protein NCAS_0B00130 [Naumovozyma castellii CBS 4309]CCC68097.1 hypothetical protein NCAS_0B00130 [Naumovozyma castellii CBS 4309]